MQRSFLGKSIKIPTLICPERLKCAGHCVQTQPSHMTGGQGFPPRTMEMGEVCTVGQVLPSLDICLVIWRQAPH